MKITFEVDDAKEGRAILRALNNKDIRRFVAILGNYAHDKKLLEILDKLSREITALKNEK